MSGLHLALAVGAAVGAAALALVLIVAAFRGTEARLLVDRLILIELVLLSGAGLLGFLLLTSRPPQDRLHILYGVVALAVLPVVRWYVQSRRGGRRITVLLVGAVVLVGVIVRLFLTGG
jgi:hypothetical protein